MTAIKHTGPELDASVVVCTFNRAQSLAKTLQCLGRQNLPDEVRWEIIVVDNNSKDETREVVEAAATSLPVIRYEFEGQQGLSHARNHGIACARARVIIFTDDDVCPEPDWVTEILKGMADWGADACGGYIAPSWEAPPPPWLTERFYGFIAVRTDEEGPRPITSVQDAPFGANMAFRRDLLQTVGGFDVERGRSGTTLSSGEDTQMFERVLAQGARIVYLPEARVHHNVEAFRVTKRYFRRWRYQNSRNIAQACGVPGKFRILNVPTYLFGQLARALVRSIAAHFAAPPDEAFFREIIVWHLLGLITGSAKSGGTGRGNGS